MKKLAIGVLMISAANAQTPTLVDGSVPLTTINSMHLMTIDNSTFTYEPKPDITTFELAEVLRIMLPALVCTNSLTCPDLRENIKALPDNVKRHFVYHER
jgi:hypothetical protein